MKIGRPLVPSEMDRFFPIFKEWADKRKMISDADLEALLARLPASSSLG